MYGVRHKGCVLHACLGPSWLPPRVLCGHRPGRDWLPHACAGDCGRIQPGGWAGQLGHPMYCMRLYCRVTPCAAGYPMYLLHAAVLPGHPMYCRVTPCTACGCTAGHPMYCMRLPDRLTVAALRLRWFLDAPGR